jgi:hypothetical protein
LLTTVSALVESSQMRKTARMTDTRPIRTRADGYLVDVPHQLPTRVVLPEG